MIKRLFVGKNNIAASKGLCNVSIYLEAPVLSGEFLWRSYSVRGKDQQKSNSQWMEWNCLSSL